MPFGCATPFCTFPVTDALVQLVVPPYDNANVCVALTRPGTRYGTDGFGILAHETAYHAQQRVKVPLLNVYSADDSLVPAFEAEMMADEVGNALQRTLEVTSGEHAYFFDRWWQQRAILLYFKGLLPRLPAAPRLRRHQPSTRRQADPRSASSSCRSRRNASADAHLAPTPATRAGGNPQLVSRRGARPQPRLRRPSARTRRNRHSRPCRRPCGSRRQTGSRRSLRSAGPTRPSLPRLRR